MSDSTLQNTQSPEAEDTQSFDGATSFSQVNDRLKEIVAAVEDDSMPLDEALTLFEEAVGLGMQASSLLEQDMASREGAQEEGTSDAAAGEANDTADTAEPQVAADSTDEPTDTSDSAVRQSAGQFN